MLGTYVKIEEKHVDWIMSPIFSERNGKVDILVNRTYFEVESILHFVIPDKIFRFYTLHDSENLETTNAQFSYNEIGAKKAAQYLINKVFNDSLKAFRKFETLEMIYNDHQISENPFLSVGIESQKGKHAIYRDLLMSSLYKPELYAAKFEEATKHFNEKIGDYAKLLETRNQKLTIDPIKSITSKLGRLDLFLKLRNLQSFDDIKNQLKNDFIKELKNKN